MTAFHLKSQAVLMLGLLMPLTTFFAGLPAQALAHRETKTAEPDNIFPEIFSITSRENKQKDSKGPRFNANRATDFTYLVASEHAQSQRLSPVPQKEFFQKLSAAQEKSQTKKIAVFVHGYNCNMAVPVKMASKLSFALKMPVVLFSWPSKRNPLAYARDECNGEWSAFQLARALDLMQSLYDNSNIVLVGHSLGCRIICWALPGTQPIPKYNQIFLCSPDMDAQIFDLNVPMLKSRSQDTRVFASSKDVRLNLSSALHGSSRVGLLKARHRTKLEAVANSEAARGEDGAVKIIDYTADDTSLLGHQMPYKLIADSIFRLQK